jgi:predicted HicB family RNase H-like nuclease
MRIDETDLKLFTKAAKASDKNLSAWIRAALREAAQK